MKRYSLHNHQGNANEDHSGTTPTPPLHSPALMEPSMTLSNPMSLSSDAITVCPQLTVSNLGLFPSVLAWGHYEILNTTCSVPITRRAITLQD